MERLERGRDVHRYHHRPRHLLYHSSGHRHPCVWNRHCSMGRRPLVWHRHQGFPPAGPPAHDHVDRRMSGKPACLVVGPFLSPFVSLRVAWGDPSTDHV